jgi:hypothetical protein
MAGNSSLARSARLRRIAARWWSLDEQHRWNPSCTLKRVTFQKRTGSTRWEEIAMTTAGTATDGLSVLEDRAQLHRAVIASTVGTTIEW